jgi:hypothetical protein
MQACQAINASLPNAIDIFGIVTNAEGWKFYKLGIAGGIYESDLHGFGELPMILGWLHDVFQACDANLGH